MVTSPELPQPKFWLFWPNNGVHLSLAVGEEIPDAHVALGRTPNLKLLDKVSPLIFKYFSYDYGKTVSGNFGGSQKLGPHGGTAWSASD